MINITDKTKCSGCSACLNICPKNAISMKEDEKGFRYPNIDYNIFKSTFNVNLNTILGYYKYDEKYFFLDDYDK